MSTSTSHRSRRAHRRGAHGGGGDFHGGGDDGGGGGGGGGDDLVKVAFARNQVEGEMLQGLLSEAGIPSVLKRSFGFDNPDFLAGGPHDVLVNEGAAKRAREVLAETMLEDEADEARELEEQRRLARGETGVVSPAKLAFWIVAIAIAAFILLWLLYQAT
ncbi:MAG: putative signal transducing protein [Solirubrobacterales bacterium]